MSYKQQLIKLLDEKFNLTYDEYIDRAKEIYHMNVYGGSEYASINILSLGLGVFTESFRDYLDDISEDDEDYEPFCITPYSWENLCAINCDLDLSDVKDNEELMCVGFVNMIQNDCKTLIDIGLDELVEVYPSCLDMEYFQADVAHLYCSKNNTIYFPNGETTSEAYKMLDLPTTSPYG